MKNAAMFVLAAGLATSSALAQDTVTVTTLFDESDADLASVLPADLPGPDGKVSFREAVAATNNQAGPNTIEFAIPQSEWWLLDDVAVLELEDGPFLITDDDTTLDFDSQTAFTGDTNPDGKEVGIYGLQVNGWGHPAIFLYGSRTTVKGLGPVMSRAQSVSVREGSNDNRFVGNVTLEIELDPYPGTTSGNVIGGTEPGEGNDLESVRILCGSNDNLVIGNRIDEVEVYGSRYCQPGNRYPLRNRIGGPTPEERNVINGFGYRSSEGYPQGEGVLVTYAKETIVENNYIGVTADGTQRVPQLGTSGIRVYDADDTVIRDNLIAGIWVQGSNHSAGQTFGTAIWVTSFNEHTYRTTIEGNIIGTDPTGTIPIRTRNGISIAPATGIYTIHDTFIGGTDPESGNVIAFTETNGITVSALVDDVLINGNRMYENALLGIDLHEFSFPHAGVTPNDPGDADDDANGLQNFPVISNAMMSGSTMVVSGSLNSRPNRSYRVEFFANGQCDDSGFGEGEHFLGSTDVMTDGNGDADFEAVVDAAPDGMVVITSTATDIAIQATSEFSACFAMTSINCLADVNGDGVLSPADFNAWIGAFNTQSPACDQNGDNACTPTDFNAWVANFNAGC